MSEDMPTTDEEWRQRLTPEQYAILRQAGTEPAFSGEHNNTKDTGTFTCAGCGEPLFDSGDKYDSGSGWPSFDRPSAEKAVKTESDVSHGMVRTEVRCAKCEGHLGHVFPDGPRETTGARFCINSAALDFKPKTAEQEPPNQA